MNRDTGEDPCENRGPLLLCFLCLHHPVEAGFCPARRLFCHVSGRAPVGAGVPDGPLYFLSARRVPRFRARVTFGRSPKSDQKRCLKPQVSRLPARLGCAENRGRVPRENQDSADRRTTNRVRPSYRCRSCVPREVRWSTAVGERLSRRSAKYSFGRRMKNGLLDPREVMCAAGERWDRAAFRMRQYSRGSGY